MERLMDHGVSCLLESEIFSFRDINMLHQYNRFPDARPKDGLPVS